jgi:GMP synthase-like glutamine amidotransferase
VWARTDHTPVQGVYIRERLFTSQGHLRFDRKMVKRQIELRLESGGIESQSEAEEAKETAHLEHDRLVVAQAILRFIAGDDAEI